MRAYGQRDPLVEYRVEAHTLFGEMMNAFKGDVASHVFRSALSLQAFEKFLSSLWQAGTFNNPEEALTASTLGSAAVSAAGQAVATAGTSVSSAGQAVTEALKSVPVRRQAPRVKPNDPCPCGSGKKYKKCCGA